MYLNTDNGMPKHRDRLLPLLPSPTPMGSGDVGSNSSLQSSYYQLLRRLLRRWWSIDNTYGISRAIFGLSLCLHAFCNKIERLSSLNRHPAAEVLA